MTDRPGRAWAVPVRHLTVGAASFALAASIRSPAGDWLVHLPAGVLLAALLRRDRHALGWSLAGMALATLATTPAPAGALADVLLALVAAFATVHLLRQVRPGLLARVGRLEAPRDLWCLLATAVLAESIALALLFALAQTTLSPPMHVHLAAVWGCAHGLGVIAAVPFLTFHPVDPDVDRREASAFVVLSLALGALVALGAWRSRAAPVVVILPMLGWATWRLGARETSAAVAMLTTIAMYNFCRGAGVFAADPSDPSAALVAQLAIGALASTFLGLTASAAERRALLRALAAARDAAEASARAKSEFLATMSHEIRTPLNGVLGVTDILRDGPLTAEQRGWTDTIAASGTALLHVLSDAIEIAHLEADRVQIDRSPLAPRALVDDVVDLFLGVASQRKLALSARVAAEVPTIVRTDPARLRQILANLVGNAVKFTDDGHVILSCVAQSSAGGTHLVFTVEDSGIGIPPDAQAAIFEAFAQADGSATRRHGGPGLGLALARRLADRLGATITVDSTPRVGSRFTVRVPVEVDHAEPEPRPATLREDTILCISPDDAVHAQLAAGLARAATSVSHLDSPREALRRLRVAERPVRLIAIDAAGRPEEATAFARAVRLHGYRGPIVMLAPVATPMSEDVCAAAGITARWRLPIRHARLADKLRTALAEVVADPAPPSDVLA